jgi:uncharacterized protein YbjT (DUF2867 family)
MTMSARAMIFTHPWMIRSSIMLVLNPEERFMRALIIGGTGKVGSAVMTVLAASGVEAVAASRHPGTDGITMDLRVPETLVAAKGFDVAFLATPLGPDETDVGLKVVAALRAAGVRKIVYLSIMNVHAMREIPHFETKIPIRDAVLSDGVSVVIEANFFFQNDVMMLPAMLHGGIYPLPVGSAGVYSVDVGDIGSAAARALMLDDWNGSAVPLCGSECLTGEGMARIWSDVLGRPIRYGGDAIEPFLGMLSQQIPEWDTWAAHDFATMMRITQELGCLATVAEIAAATKIIGHAPRKYADFVTHLVASTTGAKS